MAVETLPVRVGPWGGSTGDPFDIIELPKRLESVTIQVGTVINSFGFTYVDLAGRKHTVGSYGGDGRGELGDGRGELTTIQFEPTEHVEEFGGSIGQTLGTWVVMYLKIGTNLQTHHIYDKNTAPWNRPPKSIAPFNMPPPWPGAPITPIVGLPLPETEIPFSIPLAENTSIVGFFGRHGSNSLDAIGVYIAKSPKSLHTDTTQKTTASQDTSSSLEPLKIGAWGGDGGTTFDVTETPKRLESMTISAGDSVDAIGFSYVDEEGQKHSVGPFGGTGGQLTTIQLEPVEYVKKFSGTISGSGERLHVASLEIETNIRTYGPYGKGSSGNSFSIPLPENVSIVGFFGRAGRLLDAIGVYITYSKPPFTDATGETSWNKVTTPPLPLGQNFPIKIGYWGWGGGARFDVTEPPKRLESVVIRGSDVIDAFGFSYTDQAGQKHTVGPYGGNYGSLTTIQLEPTEYVKYFSGTTGTFLGSPPVVASLTIGTNLRVYGPYGKEQDSNFSISLPENATIVGFFGSAQNYLDAIGIYMIGSKIGTWGLGEMGVFDVTVFDVTEPPKRLDSVTIRSGDIIDSFSFSYIDQASQKHTVGPHGGNGGSLTEIQLEPTEYVVNFSGTMGAYAGSPAVASLAIETNLRAYGPYGKEQGKHFSIPLPGNASVVGFFGTASTHLNAIGVYVTSSIPN